MDTFLVGNESFMWRSSLNIRLVDLHRCLVGHELWLGTMALSRAIWPIKPNKIRNTETPKLDEDFGQQVSSIERKNNEISKNLETYR